MARPSQYRWDSRFTGATITRTNYLSFSIYTDNDQIYTFTVDNYPNDLTEDVTEIPSSISAFSWNISNFSTYLYHPEDGQLFEHRVGIQAHYTVNGEKNSSEISYLTVYPYSGVDELASGKQIANVRYYNLAGQEMAQPSGLTIQVTTFTDGTRTATKVIK